METCLLTVLLLNKVSQFTDLTDFCILSIFAFLQSQTNHSYGGGYSILRLSLQCVIWWWHLEFKETCLPQLTAKFGWSAKSKSIQELDWGSRCVGSDISWWKLYKEVRVSTCAPSAVVLSFFQQDDDLVLKSPRILENKELDEADLLESSSESDRKFSNLELSWLGDL